jgi:hypothetical protein
VEEVEKDGVLVLDVSRIGVPLLGWARHIIMIDPADVTKPEVSHGGALTPV